MPVGYNLVLRQTQTRNTVSRFDTLVIIIQISKYQLYIVIISYTSENQGHIIYVGRRYYYIIIECRMDIVK